MNRDGDGIEPSIPEIQFIIFIIIASHGFVCEKAKRMGFFTTPAQNALSADIRKKEGQGPSSSMGYQVFG
jgi:hypothetical protein